MVEFAIFDNIYTQPEHVTLLMIEAILSHLVLIGTRVCVVVHIGSKPGI